MTSEHPCSSTLAVLFHACLQQAGKRGNLRFLRSSIFPKSLTNSANSHSPISTLHSSNPQLFNALPFDSNDTKGRLDNWYIFCYPVSVRRREECFPLSALGVPLPFSQPAIRPEASVSSHFPFSRFHFHPLRILPPQFLVSLFCFLPFPLPLSHLESTLPRLLVSVDSEQLTPSLNSLESTLTKNEGEGGVTVN
jgi:hypothetical protein